MDMIHATCVAIDRVGVLLRGPSGSGKSDLALRLIDGGAALVADDRVVLNVEAGRLVARAPNAIAGLIEARGLGPLAVRATASVPVGLIVDLVAGREVERYPEPEFHTLLGVRLPLVRLDPFEASAPAKVRLAAVHFAAEAAPAPAGREAGGAR
jgi:serine kinase of HPr protein (carbohydrate metabolism regulator)